MGEPTINEDNLVVGGEYVENDFIAKGANPGSSDFGVDKNNPNKEHSSEVSNSNTDEMNPDCDILEQTPTLAAILAYFNTYKAFINDPIDPLTLGSPLTVWKILNQVDPEIYNDTLYPPDFESEEDALQSILSHLMNSSEEWSDKFICYLKENLERFGLDLDLQERLYETLLLYAFKQGDPQDEIDRLQTLNPLHLQEIIVLTSNIKYNHQSGTPDVSQNPSCATSQEELKENEWKRNSRLKSQLSRRSTIGYAEIDMLYAKNKALSKEVAAWKEKYEALSKELLTTRKDFELQQNMTIEEYEQRIDVLKSKLSIIKSDKSDELTVTERVSEEFSSVSLLTNGTHPLSDIYLEKKSNSNIPKPEFAEQNAQKAEAVDCTACEALRAELKFLAKMMVALGMRYNRAKLINHQYLAELKTRFYNT